MLIRISRQHHRLTELLITVVCLCGTVVLPGPALAQQQDAGTGIVAEGRTSLQGASQKTLNNRSGFESLPGVLYIIDRMGIDVANQRSLSLHEAIEMALDNNKDIELMRHEMRIIEYGVTSAKGVFDPRLSASSSFERSETPAISLLSGGVNGALYERSVRGAVRLEGLLPKFGSNYSFEFTSSRATTNNQFILVSPQHLTSLSFSFNQPLLRGLKTNNESRQLEIAKKNLSITDVQFRQSATDTIKTVQMTYWDLVFTMRNLQLQWQAANDARSQLEHTSRLVVKGARAPIDVVAGEKQVAQLEQNVYTALEDVARVQNALKNLIAKDRKSSLWGTWLVPSDELVSAMPAISLQDTINAGLMKRHELQQLSIATEINEIDQNYYRDQTKPQVDLTASYTLIGAAGTAVKTQAISPLMSSNAVALERINLLSRQNGLAPLSVQPFQAAPGWLFGGYGQTLANLSRNRFNIFRIGLTVSLPLHNQTAEAQLYQALVKADRLKTQRNQLEQAIQMDVRNAVQSIEIADAQLRAAKVIRRSAELQAAGEQRRFEAGLSNFFFVLEYQTASTVAATNELRAQAALNKSIAEFQHAIGNTLQANQVAVKIR